MEFEMFLQEMKRKLQDMAGADYRFEEQTIEGLNGTVKHSLLAVRAGAENICPCIPMDAYYRQYREGADMDVLAGNILESCRAEAPVRMDAVSGFTRWDLVKRRIFAKLVNTEKNEALLQKCPHRKYLDLSLAYYVRIEGKEPEEYGMIQISMEHQALWGVDESALFGAAWKNMQDAGEAALESVDDILSSFFCAGKVSGMEHEEVRMYVLGNRSRQYGAAQMCNPQALQEAAETIGDDFWVLPSSVHEVILLPLHQSEAGARGLAEIVREVNETQVEPQDVLSGHVYRYSRNAGKMLIAA